jgi:hypothetical protein
MTCQGSVVRGNSQPAKPGPFGRTAMRESIKAGAPLAFVILPGDRNPRSAPSRDALHQWTITRCRRSPGINILYISYIYILLI